MADVMRLRAQGAGAVEETWRRVVPSAVLAGPPTRSMALDWASAALPGVDVVEYELGATVRSAIEPVGQFVTCRVAARSARVATATGPLDPRMPWATDGRPVQSRWDAGARVRAFIFDAPALQRTARQLTGDDALVVRVRDAAPVSPVRAHAWERTFRYVMDTLAGVAGDRSDAILQAELARHAAVTALTAFPTTVADALDRSDQGRAAPRAVRRAIAYIEAHAAEPMTVDDAATAASMSTRGLQYAFRRELGVTPTEYLRTVRLAAAHDDLTAGAGSTVGEIARRWGFSNAARFARYYREAYGRSPADTFRGR